MEIVRNAQIEVRQGMLVVDLINEPLEWGKTSLVRFTLENTGAANIDLVVATKSGQAASTEVSFSLLDSDGNVITTLPLQPVRNEAIFCCAHGS